MLKIKNILGQEGTEDELIVVVPEGAEDKTIVVQEDAEVKTIVKSKTICCTTLFKDNKSEKPICIIFTSRIFDLKVIIKVVKQLSFKKEVKMKEWSYKKALKVNQL